MKLEYHIYIIKMQFVALSVNASLIGAISVRMICTELTWLCKQQEYQKEGDEEENADLHACLDGRQRNRTGLALSYRLHIYIRSLFCRE